MSVKFRSRQAYLSVAHEELFHVGVQNILKDEAGNWIGTSGGTEAKEAVSKLPDPEMVGCSYCFSEGKNHNQLTLTRDDAIEGMRAYIQRRGDNLITELEV